MKLKCVAMHMHQLGVKAVIDQLSLVIDQHAECRHRFTIEEEKQFKSLQDALKEAKEGQPVLKPKIQKVPFMLRDNTNFNKYFKPRVVSVGPYHHKDTNLKLTEPIKLKLAAFFIQENKVNEKNLYANIKAQIEILKDCYDDKATKDYEDRKLAWMFLVDGCAILQYMDTSVAAAADEHDQGNAGKKLKELGIKTHHVAFVHQDLEMYKNNDKLLQENHVHLLDLLRKTLVQPVGNKKAGLREKLVNFVTVDLLAKLKRKKKDEYWHSFRNIEELKAVGIDLEPSETSSVRDITFSCGTLKLPPIMVDDSTATKFLNLAAYEMCPDFQNEFEVSSYIFFLDSLIDRAQDVKELRENKILHNALGSDEEVAKLFNEISIDLVPNDEIYFKVKSNIQNHCNNKCLTWLYEFLHDHFQSPWSAIAFIGAVLALASSIIQTVYTVRDYYKEKKG
ncbi:hypothetical protein JRO89_XS11G0063900 [Xanthoceras sorbifolium]|uniref:Uncharacterized protein n=1 Tax=Xanthoceras sorbifolium TaxID=99658 RepID=A0ABQ8HEX0_9ROSI|nr:hypothetical protein JRO89_XS11G0063900 [Xanthoceras sorbifolium]